MRHVPLIAVFGVFLLVSPFLVLQVAPPPLALVASRAIRVQPDGTTTRYIVMANNLNLGKMHMVRRTLPPGLQEFYLPVMNFFRSAYFYPFGRLYCELTGAERYYFL